MSYRRNNIINYALNCLQRYRMRTAVILISLTITSALFSSVLFVKDGLVKEGEISLKYAPDLTVQGIESGRQTYVDTSYMTRINTIYGVEHSTERIWGYGNIGNTLVVIIGVENDPSHITSAYPIESGTFLDENRNDTVVIGKAVAELLGAQVGNYLSIITESNHVKKYLIVGIFNSESGIINADTILMGKEEARSFFNVPAGMATDILIYTEDINPDYYKTQVNFIAREVSKLPNVRVLTKDTLVDAQETTYGSRSGFFSIVWYLVLIAVALISFNQTVVVGHESKFEVGLLKALGFSTEDIIQVRLIEGTILGLISGSLGIITAIIYIGILNAPILREFMLGWATLYPSFQTPYQINIQSVALTYTLTIIPILFATVIPSWLNAIVDPDIAMRGARA